MKQSARQPGQIGREQVLPALKAALEPLDYVHAMWEGGAVSFDRIDEMSDIDLYVDVEDSRVADVFPVVEESLERLAGIKLKYCVPLPPSHPYAQAFYRLKHASEFLLVDVAVMKHGAEDKFLEPEIHGKALFHFNKNGAVAVPHVDADKFVENLRGRVEKMKARFEMFRCFVPREMKRGNYVEALDLYTRLVLELLLEALRMKHRPLHYNFRTHHILYDLPRDVVERLRALYFVSDETDLARKLGLAEEWFWQTVREIDFGSIRRDLGSSK
ncbi:MAG: hypothetical protein JW952_07180 [Candidatus Eisenbacteria bacterium]|nr:hypothetical protein [Candidatus Eisenbacteria bacterium]